MEKLTILYYTIYSRYTFYRWLLLGGLCLSVSIPFLRLSIFERPALVLHVTVQYKSPVLLDNGFPGPKQ